MINNFVIAINYNYLYSINNGFWLYNFPDLWILIENKMENRLINVNDIYCMLSVKLHDHKASWEGEGLFDLYFHIAVHHQKKSWQELKQDKNLESGRMFLICFLFMASAVCFLIELRAISSGMVQLKATCLFPGHPDSKNNHMETIVFKSLIAH